MKIREGNLTIEELLIDISGAIFQARKYSDTSSLVDLKSALVVIHGAAGARGDHRTAGIAMDMEYAIDDWLQRGDDSSYLPSEEKITTVHYK